MSLHTIISVNHAATQALDIPTSGTEKTAAPATDSAPATDTVPAAHAAPETRGGPAVEASIGPSTLARIAAAWPRRATIRTDMQKVAGFEEYEPDLLDYPVSLLPFAEHPEFLAASDEQRRRVNTLAWLAFNERVIAAEEFVANPTFEMLAHGVFPGVETVAAREAVQQSHIDEVWHTYMHMIAIRRTREARGITDDPAFTHPITNRVLYEMEAKTTQRWERDLLYLLWTAVGEISVNEFLDLVARDSTIQPMHARVARLHARDEAAHGPVMYEITKEIYTHLNREQRELFAAALPAAIVAFGAQDYVLWPEVLRSSGFAHADDIIAESRDLPGAELLVTDFSGIHRLVRDLGISDQVDFDFAAVHAGV
jgi:hypothetical protein